MRPLINNIFNTPGDIPFNIEDHVHELNKDAESMITMKECIIDIVNGKCEIDYDEEDETVVDTSTEKEDEGDKDKDKDIEDNVITDSNKSDINQKESMKTMNTLIKEIKEKVSTFDKLQKELYDIDEEYKKEVRKIREKMDTIDSMVSFVQRLSSDSVKEESIQEIITKMKRIGEDIIRSQKMRDIKKRYAYKRKELGIYLHMIKQINNMNHTNMCAICLSKPVDHYSNPCGHTACKGCFDNNRQEIGQNETMLQSNTNYKCPFCREYIQSIKPLFFL